MNNVFLVTHDGIYQWFSPHSWQKIVMHGNSCITLYICNGEIGELCLVTDYFDPIVLKKIPIFPTCSSGTYNHG